jgi:(1->4)-alpha-D-glucan 1-alpha-D-glucosylmutase
MLKKHIPVATYRIQFNADFPLKSAFDTIGYLRKLGISDIYSSPLTKAAPGSQHGYDVIDPTRLNPEICDFKGLKQFTNLLHQNNMALLMDFVPNHMSASNHNKWWRDVIKNGKNSPYAGYFDINWQVKNKISYRRFFDINELVCLRMEDKTVFKAVHSLIWKLISKDMIDGLRIDHIDGLLDPAAYLVGLKKNIQKIIGQDFYVIVEKILANDESIRPQWRIEGTTGYDFLNAVNAIFVDKNGYQYLVDDYKRFTGVECPWSEVRRQSKKQVIKELFQEEMEKLLDSLKIIMDKSNRWQAEEFKIMVEEISAILPLYRTYIHDFVISLADHKYLIKTFIEAKKKIGNAHSQALLMIKKIFNMKKDFRSKKTLKWIMRWQQFTGPVMAKGFEDTACYVYNPLISLNEVGSDPQMEKNYGETEVLHKFLKNRQRSTPYSLNATSTHDTKRSEDVRMRLNVLSELAEEWISHLKNWSRLVQPLKVQLEQTIVPDPNFEILLYQSLLGAWPISSERVKGFSIKAAREAKVNTSWKSPNLNYETALLFFMDSLLKNDIFLNAFLPFQKKIAFHGALNSLSEVLIKIAAPGVPDFYQGTEIWNYSLVDPDNRHSVDFSKIRRQLENLLANSAADREILTTLCKNWSDGNIKLFLIQKLLQFRQNNSAIFQAGRYIPVQADGAHKLNVYSFCRVHDGRWILVAVPRFTTRLCTQGKFPIGEAIWQDTQIILPKNAPKRWSNVLSNERLEAEESLGQPALKMQALLSSFPVGFYSSDK